MIEVGNGSGTGASSTTLESPQRIYVVKPRDTLWSIANAELGNPLAWRLIAAANYGRLQPDGQELIDDHWIRPGWRLVIPTSGTGAPPAPAAEPTSLTMLIGPCRTNSTTKVAPAASLSGTSASSQAILDSPRSVVMIRIGRHSLRSRVEAWRAVRNHLDPMCLLRPSDTDSWARESWRCSTGCEEPNSDIVPLVFASRCQKVIWQSWNEACGSRPTRARLIGSTSPFVCFPFADDEAILRLPPFPLFSFVTTLSKSCWTRRARVRRHPRPSKPGQTTRAGRWRRVGNASRSFARIPRLSESMHLFPRSSPWVEKRPASLWSTLSRLDRSPSPGLTMIP